MTREEFLESRAKLERESPPHDKLVAITLSALAVGGLPLSRVLTDEWLWAYIGGLFLAGSSYAIYGLRWFHKTGLLCHSCRLPLLNRAADVALSSGTCPRCRKAAFAELG